MERSNKSHVSVRAAQFEALKSEILHLLNWSVTEWWNYYVDQATDYLRSVLGNDREAYEVISRQTIFWNWWKNKWLLSDEAYLSDEGMEDLGVQQRRSIYHGVHSGNIMAADTPLDKVVLASVKAIVYV